MNKQIKNYAYYTIIKKEDILKNNDDLKNQNESYIAKYLLTKMLKQFNIELPNIKISPNGKPFFEKSNIFFNYSHTQKYIACVISNYEIGIDIEETNRIISDNISKKYLNGTIDNKKRIEQWVRKEAYSKMKGLGLLIDFKKIDINKLPTNNLFIDTKDYMCSIYCEGNVVYKEILLQKCKI